MPEFDSSQTLYTGKRQRNGENFFSKNWDKGNTRYFYMGVGFIGIVQSSRIFFNSIFNIFPFLYKFESLGFQMQATDKGGSVGTGLIQ